jgi:hypothetical protein
MSLYENTYFNKLPNELIDYIWLIHYISAVKVIQKPATVSRKAPLKVNVQPTKRKNFTMKRKFLAKKITINIENANKIKNKRDTIEKKVANMTLSEVTEKLHQNGLVRPTANPPEKMQRGWMVDFMMFQVPL